MLKKLFHKLAVLFMAAIICCTGCSRQEEQNQSSEQDKLVVYTSHKKSVYEPIISEFEERTGISVEVHTGGTNELLEQIQREEKDPKCDVMFGGGVDSLTAYGSCFASYESRQCNEICSDYESDTHVYTVFSNTPIVFLYNKKLVNRQEAPARWEDLLEEKWKGEIAFADPEKSGSSFTALVSLILAMEQDSSSEEETISAFGQNMNGPAEKTSGDVISLVEEGKKRIGITLEETARKAQEENPDLEICMPQPPTMVPDGTAIVKEAAHLENAELFVDFTISTDVQRFLEEYLYRHSVRSDLSDAEPEGDKIYDMEYANTNRSRILEQWNKEMEQEQ